MTPQEFDYIRDLLKERSGLVLGDEKRYLIESRLMPVARKEGMDSLSDLVTGLKGAGSEELRTKVTQAMTINESFFFRDKTPFENFKDIVVPAMLASSRSASRSMRIWCAAASTMPARMCVCAAGSPARANPAPSVLLPYAAATWSAITRSPSPATASASS